MVGPSALDSAPSDRNIPITLPFSSPSPTVSKLRKKEYNEVNSTLRSLGKIYKLYIPKNVSGNKSGCHKLQDLCKIS